MHRQASLFAAGSKHAGRAARLGFRFTSQRVWSERCERTGKFRQRTRRDKIPGDHCKRACRTSLFRPVAPLYIRRNGSTGEDR